MTWHSTACAFKAVSQAPAPFWLLRYGRPDEQVPPLGRASLGQQSPAGVGATMELHALKPQLTSGLQAMRSW